MSLNTSLNMSSGLGAGYCGCEVQVPSHMRGWLSIRCGLELLAFCIQCLAKTASPQTHVEQVVRHITSRDKSAPLSEVG
jgi:hypothetical protein